MDINRMYNYKNAEIEVIIEDDIITTAKVYMDGECVFADDTFTDAKRQRLEIHTEESHRHKEVLYGNC